MLPVVVEQVVLVRARREGVEVEGYDAVHQQGGVEAQAPSSGVASFRATDHSTPARPDTMSASPAK